MTWRHVMRIAAGILIGIAIGALPFVHYATCSHHHSHHHP
jgi:hypothetical protein